MKRCTQATLEALGIFGICPMTGAGVVSAMAARYKAIPMDVDGTMGLFDFIAANQYGKFYLASKGHAMALVDGVLTDTSKRRITNRIKIVLAVKAEGK